MTGSGRKELASLHQVGLVSPGRTLLTDMELSVKTGETIVVRGESGSGKSRLLRMIAGQDNPDEGTISRRGGVTQEFVSATFEDRPGQSNLTIREYYLEARGLRQLDEKKTQLERAMTNGDTSKRTTDEYGRVLEQYELLGGYTAETEIIETIAGLNVSEQKNGRITPDVRLNQVSSGQRTKLAIGRALFSRAELLILDDPTAHLDERSVAWLNGQLARQENRAIVIASNDDRVASNSATSQIVQIEDTGRTFTFRGSLSDFEQKRTAQLQAEEVVRTAAIRQRDGLQRTYERFRNEGDFKRSKDFAATGRAMQTRLERMNDQIEEMPEVRATPKQAHKRKLVIEDSGRQVSDSSIVIRGVRRTYGGRGGVDTTAVGEIRVKKGERLIVSGSNGSGKSTLLRMIANEATGQGEFSPEQGDIVIGSRQRVGYFAPDHMGLSQSRDVLEEVESAMERVNEGRAVGILTSMGFDSHRIRKQRVSSLSAGEKQQLALAKLIASNPDVLILDEPTSNLRPEIKERFARALNEFQGSVVIVDHDPEFTRQLRGSHTVDLTPSTPSYRKR
jgi:ATP-binding cassette subfamily F protein 3